ncbi:unnamed protein product [Ilex paraguariensis]|uniref:Uncharacterized protein n=1 Tax=Ilex paraguariensis TaxID=185542 RepID=A0ABC8UFZ8_9AQUA
MQRTPPHQLATRPRFPQTPSQFSSQNSVFLFDSMVVSYCHVGYDSRRCCALYALTPQTILFCYLREDLRKDGEGVFLVRAEDVEVEEVALEEGVEEVETEMAEEVETEMVEVEIGQEMVVEAEEVVVVIQ